MPIPLNIVMKTAKIQKVAGLGDFHRWQQVQKARRRSRSMLGSKFQKSCGGRRFSLASAICRVEGSKGSRFQVWTESVKNWLANDEKLVWIVLLERCFSVEGCPKNDFFHQKLPPFILFLRLLPDLVEKHPFFDFLRPILCFFLDSFLQFSPTNSWATTPSGVSTESWGRGLQLERKKTQKLVKLEAVEAQTYDLKIWVRRFGAQRSQLPGVKWFLML